MKEKSKGQAVEIQHAIDEIVNQIRQMEMLKRDNMVDPHFDSQQVRDREATILDKSK